MRAQIQGRGFDHLRANADWIVAASANGATVWANDLTEVRRIAQGGRVALLTGQEQIDV